MANKKKDPVAEKLAQLKALADAAPTSLAEGLRPFVDDKHGLVVAEAARLVAEHRLRALVPHLERAFVRLLSDPVKNDPGCRGKLGIAEALRQLDAPAAELYFRGVACRQPEPSFGPPVDTAANLRVCCAAALLETGVPQAFLEAAALLADAEPIARAGVTAVLANVGNEAAEAVLRLKVLLGDREADVLGACIHALLGISLPRSLPFVVEAMGRASSQVREQALLALGETRDEHALPPLREHADDPDPDVRAAALLGLSLARLAPADEFLLSRLEDASDGAAREILRALKPRLYDDALVARLREKLEGRRALLAWVDENVPRG